MALCRAALPSLLLAFGALTGCEGSRKHRGADLFGPTTQLPERRAATFSAGTSVGNGYSGHHRSLTVAAAGSRLDFRRLSASALVTFDVAPARLDALHDELRRLAFDRVESRSNGKKVFDYTVHCTWVTDGLDHKVCTDPTRELLGDGDAVVGGAQRALDRAVEQPKAGVIRLEFDDTVAGAARGSGVVEVELSLGDAFCGAAEERSALVVCVTDAKRAWDLRARLEGKLRDKEPFTASSAVRAGTSVRLVQRDGQVVMEPSPPRP